jgi:hypothetical protein
VSCNKIDDLGGLEEQWQMTEWVDAEGQLYATQEIQIYYRFQLGLIAFHKVSHPDGFIHARFENRDGAIRIYSPFEYGGAGHSNILSMATLQKYGVPQNGMMKIEELTSSKLVLSSPDVGTLSFRKY